MTPAELKARYPEFTDVPDITVGVYISEASLCVGEDWRPDDIPIALMALAAHLMSVEGYPDRLITSSVDASGAQLTQRRVGDVSEVYAQVQHQDRTWSSTLYGRKYAEILKRNSIGIWAV